MTHTRSFMRGGWLGHLPVRRAFVAASIALLALVSSGCGYRLVGQASNLPEDIGNVYVETLENKTQRSQVEQILTQAIIEEMVTRKRFNLVNDEDDADAVLRGSVVTFAVRPVTFDNNGLADNFEITITADMKFQRVPAAGQLAEDAEVVWSNARYLFRQDYAVEGGGFDFFDRENLAIEETAERFAEVLIVDLLEGF